MRRSRLLPTPIEHLVIAEHILASPKLPGEIRALVNGSEIARGAFYLGHIAPDVQVISGQSREDTHFFTLPPTGRRPAYESMLAVHPNLAQPSRLPPAQAAFLVGYLSHLLLDEFWVREIFYPVFGPGQSWGDRRERLLLHNVLRAWLDRRDLARLRDGVGDVLREAKPDGWLPFVSDANLCRWRDVVADQFRPGAAIRTVEIFANRARIPNSEFLTLLEPAVMNKRIFSRVALSELDRFHGQAVLCTQGLTEHYLNGCAVSESV
jgi:hypothetical protein